MSGLQKMETILVTGGKGFIGKTVVRHLVNDGIKDKIIVLDRLKGDSDYMADIICTENVKIIESDLRDYKLVKSIVEECDIVYHLAANTKVNVGYNNTSIDYEDNIVATRNVLESMHESSKCKKIIFTSSSTVLSWLIN